VSTSSYRVEHRDDCTLIFGAMPIQDMVRLSDSCTDAVVAFDLARLAGASLAFGPVASVQALTEKLRQAALDAPPAEGMQHLSAKAQAWLKGGEQGLSSCTMFAICSGYLPDYLQDCTRPKHYPADPDDFGRCQKLIEAVPEVAEANRQLMPTVSTVWSALITAWTAILSCMEDESPDWRTGKLSAPRTYDLMQEVIESSASRAPRS